MSHDNWDSFDFTTWGASADTSESASDQQPTPTIGLRADTDRLRQRLSDDRRALLAAAASGAPTNPDALTDLDAVHPNDEGRWVSHNGHLTWEEPDDADDEQRSPQAEANSRWAAEDIDLPPGAPDGLRIRAVRAWLLRQRLLETEALGSLLLARRAIEAPTDPDAAPPPPQRHPRHTPVELSPLDLELLEHQAAIDEFESLVESLDDIIAHNGPARVLIEYYLAIAERLAQLGSQPETTAEFIERLRFPLAQPDDPTPQPTTPQSHAQWRGRADAALQARRRLEWVSAPEED